MAADFDQQMSTVQANTGATGAELDQLRQAAIEAGASTVYSASESADAINDLGKAGMSVTDHTLRRPDRGPQPRRLGRHGRGRRRGIHG